MGEAAQAMRMDLDSARQRLASISLANPHHASYALGDFLDQLLAAPPAAPKTRLEILEAVRQPLAHVMEERARQYHNKPLPLAEVEERIFQEVLATWQKMMRLYAGTAGQLPHQPDNPEFARMMALILQRSISYCGLMIFEHFRARRELPKGLWQDFHRYYVSAEDWGVTVSAVDDPLQVERTATHCMATYVALLLIDLGGPYSHSVRDMQLIRRWATQWAPLVLLKPVAGSEKLPPQLIDFQHDAPLTTVCADISDLQQCRRLSVSRLAERIDLALERLRNKVLPSQLGLGDETPSHVIRLLEGLRRPWRVQSAARQFRRYAAEGYVRLCAGFEAMHACLSGREFGQPDAADTYSRQEFVTLFTFREMSDPTHKFAIGKPVDVPLEAWAVINQSASGFRLSRSSAGQRLMHGQILALRPHDGNRYLLAVITWLMQERDAGLIAGIAILPGMPEAIAVRHAPAPGGLPEKFVPAFRTAAVASMDEVEALILPLGMYVASRQIDLHDGRMHRIKLKHLLQRGADYERVSFEQA